MGQLCSIMIPTTEVGIYKKTRKKERKHDLHQDSDQKSHQEKKKFLD